MQDLTQGSITRHLVSMAAFIGVGLIFQTLYFLIDLYFVAHLGSAAIAGVSAAGVVFFLCLGVSQLIGVGGMALISQAVGRKDADGARIHSDQALSLSLAFLAATLVLGYLFGRQAIELVAADAEVAQAGWTYLMAFLPALAIMFPTTALTTALRAAGIAQPTMIVQTVTVILNAILAPVLIAGWGTGAPMGVAGAGLASSIAALVGLVIVAWMFPRVQKFVHLDLKGLTPRFDEWRRIIGVGLPAAGEFLLMFVIISIVYWVIRHFGPHAQAGFGIAARIGQSIFLPAMAVAFASAPIVGQNFGARRPERVRETFRQTVILSTLLMGGAGLLVWVAPELLLSPFTSDPQALAVGAEYMRISAWNYVASGIVFSCSSAFQGLGDTRPSFFASATRLITFAAPAIWLVQFPTTTLGDIWLVGVGSILLQAVLSYVFLRRVFRKRLTGLAPLEPAPQAA